MHEVKLKLPILHAEVVLSLLKWAVQQQQVIDESKNSMIHTVNLTNYVINELDRELEKCEHRTPNVDEGGS